ncbi:hypothetical protein SLA2020_231020 [Shorea laevis]
MLDEEVSKSEAKRFCLLKKQAVFCGIHVVSRHRFRALADVANSEWIRTQFLLASPKRLDLSSLLVAFQFS